MLRTVCHSSANGRLRAGRDTSHLCSGTSLVLTIVRELKVSKTFLWMTLIQYFVCILDFISISMRFVEVWRFFANSGGTFCMHYAHLKLSEIYIMIFEQSIVENPRLAHLTLGNSEVLLIRPIDITHQGNQGKVALFVSLLSSRPGSSSLNRLSNGKNVASCVKFALCW